MQPETWAVIAGRGTADGAVPLNVPPVLASNFELGSGRAYSRDDATPTWEAFEELLGGLEGGHAVAFASGMGAAAAIFDLLAVSATVVLGDDCYQGVVGLCRRRHRAAGPLARGPRRRRGHGALARARRRRRPAVGWSRRPTRCWRSPTCPPSAPHGASPAR